MNAKQLKASPLNFEGSDFAIAADACECGGEHTAVALAGQHGERVEHFDSVDDCMAYLLGIANSLVHEGVRQEDGWALAHLVTTWVAVAKHGVPIMDERKVH